MIKKKVGQLSNAPKNGHLMHIDPKLYNKCPPKSIGKLLRNMTYCALVD